MNIYLLMSESCGHESVCGTFYVKETAVDAAKLYNANWQAAGTRYFVVEFPVRMEYPPIYPPIPPDDGMTVYWPER